MATDANVTLFRRTEYRTRDQHESQQASKPAHDMLATLRSRLISVVAELQKIQNDIAMAEAAYDSYWSQHSDAAPNYITNAEIVVLAAALYQQANDQAFSYADVMQFTEDRGRKMNLTRIYDCFQQLHSKGLIEEEEENRSSITGRARQTYRLTENGRVILSLYLAASNFVADSRSQAAA